MWWTWKERGRPSTAIINMGPNEKGRPTANRGARSFVKPPTRHRAGLAAGRGPPCASVSPTHSLNRLRARQIEAPVHYYCCYDHCYMKYRCRCAPPTSRAGGWKRCRTLSLLSLPSPARLRARRPAGALVSRPISLCESVRGASARTGRFVPGFAGLSRGKAHGGGHSAPRSLVPASQPLPSNLPLLERTPNTM